MKQSSAKFKPIKDFIDANYLHFNSSVVKTASQAYVKHLSKGGRMLLAMGGAMSTAELGITLAEMIRQGKIHAISCTGANLEEDIFNLVAHKSYRTMCPHYRTPTADDEEELLKQGLNRVTDTCIPEEEAMRRIEKNILRFWQKADRNGERYFPYEYMYQLIRSGVLKKYYQIDPKNSWVIAACEKNLPIFVARLGGFHAWQRFRRRVPKREYPDLNIVKSGVETMAALIDWYKSTSEEELDRIFPDRRRHRRRFPDMRRAAHTAGPEETSARSGDTSARYRTAPHRTAPIRGAVPNEKITWEKLDAKTPEIRDRERRHHRGPPHVRLHPGLEVSRISRYSRT